MATAGLNNDTQSVEEFFAHLNGIIRQTSAIENEFYTLFRHGGLNAHQLQIFTDQYYYYIRTFPQILAGLAHRVEDEVIRVELAKTVVSELGNGQPGKIHFQLFEKAIGALGISPGDIRRVKHIPEADMLVEGIRDLFLTGSPASALGGHYTIEQTGLPMIVNLYEGFRTYSQSTVESMEYFYLHMLVENDHVEWIKAAVRPFLWDRNQRTNVEWGARHIADLLSKFWHGLYRSIYVEQPWPQGVVG